jgi:hypothetical protein
MIALPLLFAIVTTGAPVRPAIEALVIGNNLPIGDSQPLRYADDDAVRWWELLREYADSVQLLTVLDQQTAGAHAEAREAAQVPTRAALDRGLKAAFARLKQAREEGREAVFFFIYSGHGGVIDGESYVHLQSSELFRAELFHDVIAAAPEGTWTHVFIDACNSDGMLGWRGDGMAAVRGFLDLEDPAHFPTTGLFGATSSESKTNEWGVWQAGILSHEAQSALTGAADVDGDGRLTYDEVAAFVSGANAAIPNPNAQLSVLYRPPDADRQKPILDFRWGRFRRFLTLLPSDAGRFWLEDGMGVRYADFNEAADHMTKIALLDQREYWIKDEHREARISIPQSEQKPDGSPVEVAFAGLHFVPSDADRGPLEQTFRRYIFSQEFGKGFYSGFLASRRAPPAPGAAVVPVVAARSRPASDVAPARPAPVPPVDLPPSATRQILAAARDAPQVVLKMPAPPTPPRSRSWWKWPLAGVGGSALAAGAVLMVLSRLGASSLARTPMNDPATVAARLQTENKAGIALLAGGGLLVAGAAPAFIVEF